MKQYYYDYGSALGKQAKLAKEELEAGLANTIKKMYTRSSAFKAKRAQEVAATAVSAGGEETPQTAGVGAPQQNPQEAQIPSLADESDEEEGADSDDDDLNPATINKEYVTLTWIFVLEHSLI